MTAYETLLSWGITVSEQVTWQEVWDTCVDPSLLVLIACNLGVDTNTIFLSGLDCARALVPFAPDSEFLNKSIDKCYNGNKDKEMFKRFKINQAIWSILWAVSAEEVNAGLIELGSSGLQAAYEAVDFDLCQIIRKRIPYEMIYKSVCVRNQIIF